MMSTFWPGTSFCHLGTTVIIRHTCTMLQNPAAETLWTSLKRLTNRLRLFSNCLNDPITSLHSWVMQHGSCDTHTLSAVSARHTITRNHMKRRYEACLIPKYPKVSNQNSVFVLACVCLAAHQNAIARWGSNDWHQHRYCGAGQHLRWKSSKFWFVRGWCCIDGKNRTI